MMFSTKNWWSLFKTIALSKENVLDQCCNLFQLMANWYFPMLILKIENQEYSVSIKELHKSLTEQHTS